MWAQDILFKRLVYSVLCAMVDEKHLSFEKRAATRLMGEAGTGKMAKLFASLKTIGGNESIFTANDDR